MTQALNVVGIAGSLREASYSRIVLETIVDLLPAGSRFDPIDIGTLPHYNEDLEKTALPVNVAQARDLVARSDAVVLVVPEFNHGIPGVLKNTLDWLSRPAHNSCMKDKPVFFATVSPGALGGVRAQYQLRETLFSMLCRVVALPEIAVTHVGQKVTDGRLVDQGTRDFMAAQLEHFIRAIPARAEPIRKAA